MWSKIHKSAKARFTNVIVHHVEINISIHQIERKSDIKKNNFQNETLSDEECFVHEKFSRRQYFNCDFCKKTVDEIDC